MYLMTSIKFDLTFFVDNCVRFISNFNVKHFKIVKRIWQYVRTIKNKKIKYHISFKLDLIEYVDSN